MADKIYNIGDYRKTDPAPEAGATTEAIESINIEDPLNFLDASEKEAYIRERHREEKEKERRLEEKEHAASAAARSLPEEERTKLKRDTDDPLGDRPVRRRPDPEEAPRRREDRPRPENRRREPVRDWEPEEEEEDEDEGNGIIIAAAILGIVIMIAAVFLGWMTFFAPQPEEPEADERALQEAQAEEEKGQSDDDEEEGSGDDGEEDASDYALIPEGFELCDDTVVTTTQLNMRSEPDSSNDSNKVTSVPEGTKLTRVAVNHSSGWSAVYVDGQDEVLYCSNKYLKEE